MDHCIIDPKSLKSTSVFGLACRCIGYIGGPIYISKHSSVPVGGGHSDTEWLPTAKRPWGAEAVNAKR